MQQDELRKLIREAIANELRRDTGGRRLAGEPREEVVSISSDVELATFVHRLLDMVGDSETRDDIRAGRLNFRLAGVASHQRPEAKPMVQPFVTERWVDALPEETTVVTLGKGTRLTPLARDRLRSKKIRIERAAT